MTAPTPDAMQRLIDAAEALLDARANAMVTIAEWRNLRDAVVACGGVAELDDEEEAADARDR